MPLGQGYTVEAQLTGKEVVGGLTFEITPAFCKFFFLMYEGIFPSDHP